MYGTMHPCTSPRQWQGYRHYNKKWLVNHTACQHACGTALLRGSFKNTLRMRRNRQHFADVNFKRIFLNENVWISIKKMYEFLFKVHWSLFEHWLMAWCRPGDKPLSQPLPTHIRSQRVNHICVDLWKEIQICICILDHFSILQCHR